MSKAKRQHRCRSCGYVSTRWLGRCPECEAWDSFEPEDEPRSAPAGRALRAVTLAAVEPDQRQRLAAGIGEFDRVVGGGLVTGAVVLVGGEPGVGKSTLLLQVSAALAGGGAAVLYLSGEESAQQLRLRAERLGLLAAPVEILCATALSALVETIRAARPAAVIVDSIQTVRDEALEALPGSVTQVRECTSALAQVARETGAAVVLVGHVTKEGNLAGPKVTEHIVDTVLQFEGDRTAGLKVLRAAKNRFGSTDEVGLFEMGERGLTEVPNPSRLLLSERVQGVSGTATLATLEGTRSLLLEVQALAAPTPFVTPRRVASGLDVNRLHLLLAVLERRCAIRLADRDVYVNLVGGVRVTEPAADLAVVAAVASSVRDEPLDSQAVLFGEVGLTGEIRAVSRVDRRLEEAARMGFQTAVIPSHGTRDVESSGLRLIRVDTVSAAVEALLGGPAVGRAVNNL